MIRFLLIQFFILVLYGLYAGLFKKTGMFVWSRIYLLSLVPASVLLVYIPDILPFPEKTFFIQLPVVTAGLSEDMLMPLADYGAEGKVSLVSMFLYLYATVSVAIAGKYLSGHIYLLSTIGKEQKIPSGEYILVNSQKFKVPFSYFRYLIMPDDNGSKEDYQLIINHEKTHIRQKHSWDLILLQIFTVLFWINPAVWLLMKEIKVVHECLADKSVLQQTADKEKYYELLLKTHFNITVLSLVNPFNYSPLKYRIMMMKNKNTQKKKITHLILLPVLMVMFLLSYGQTIDNSSTRTHGKRLPNSIAAATVSQGDSVYTKVDEPPEYPGGMVELMTYLSKNIKYPKEAKRKGAEGTVFISFIVEKNGTISDAKVIRGFDQSCEAEALRVVKAMPEWKPGKDKGKTVKVKFVLPVKFVISNKEKSKDLKKEKGLVNPQKSL